jgi:hypothetical protein
MLQTLSIISVYAGDTSQRETLQGMQVCFVFAGCCEVKLTEIAL